MNRELFGLPVYAWAAGLAAFGIGVFAFLRSKPRGGATTQISAPPSQPTTSGGLPVPYPTSGPPISLSPGGYIVDNNTGELVPTGSDSTPIVGSPQPPFAPTPRNIPPSPPPITWHFGTKDSQTRYWRWLPDIAQNYGLPTAPFSTDSTLDPNQLFAQGKFPEGVPLAYSWQYGDQTPDLSVAQPAAATAAKPSIVGSNYVPALHGWGQ